MSTNKSSKPRTSKPGAGSKAAGAGGSAPRSGPVDGATGAKSGGTGPAPARGNAANRQDRGRWRSRPDPLGTRRWLAMLKGWVTVNWQAKLISLVIAFVVWYLARASIDQDRLWLPPDFHPGSASLLTTPPTADTVARSNP